MPRTNVIRTTRIVAIAAAALVAGSNLAFAQPLGTFGWQLQPYCNRVTANVVQTGAVYTLDGYDDQCGAAQRAPLVGLATPNPDGSIGLGFTIVTVPGGRPAHVEARISLPSVSGSWSDSAGLAGTFLFGGNGAGSPRPAPSGIASPASVDAAALVPGAVTSAAIADGSIGMADIDTAQVQRRIPTTCARGTFFSFVSSTGAATCSDGVGGTLSNTALGELAFAANTTGYFSVAIGSEALFANTSGGNNVAVGDRALRANTTGNSNVALGSGALVASATGDGNIAFGSLTLSSNTGGSANIGIGTNALFANVRGTGNVAVGQLALSTTTGSFNTAVGDRAGSNVGIGSNNVHVANLGMVDDTATIRIGTSGSQTRAFLAGVRGVTTGTTAIPVLIGTDGQLGTTSSSRRFKTDIADMGDASAAILRLRPVTFRYTQPQADRARPLEIGLIAEEVADVMPALAVFDQDGRPETVAYHKLPALLLNELQKLARVVEQQRAELAALRAALSAAHR